ncbi:hypothetical protein D3C73_1293140 [compost metagenome]
MAMIIHAAVVFDPERKPLFTRIDKQTQGKLQLSHALCLKQVLPASALCLVHMKRKIGVDQAPCVGHPL